MLLIAARSGEPDLQAFATNVKNKRLEDSATIADQLAATGDLRPDIDRARTRDLIWAYNSPELHQLLTQDRGWSALDYNGGSRTH